MRTIMNFDDVKKLIEESYAGVNDVTTRDEDMEIMLDVDADTFSKISINNHNRISDMKIRGNTKDIITKFEPGAKIDYDTVLLQKELEKEEHPNTGKMLADETHIPLVKTIEEKNKEASKKGLMTTGRGAKRTIVKG